MHSSCLLHVYKPLLLSYFTVRFTNGNEREEKAVDDYPTDVCAGGGIYKMKNVWFYATNMTDRQTHTLITDCIVSMSMGTDTVKTSLSVY
jgi:hypothetical protein